MATKGKFPANLFKGTESMDEELKEAKAIKSGKITPMQYAKGEKAEDAKTPKNKMPMKFAKGGSVMPATHSVLVGKHGANLPLARKGEVDVGAPGFDEADADSTAVTRGAKQSTSGEQYNVPTTTDYVKKVVHGTGFKNKPISIARGTNDSFQGGGKPSRDGIAQRGKTRAGK